MGLESAMQAFIAKTAQRLTHDLWLILIPSDSF